MIRRFAWLMLLVAAATNAANVDIKVGERAVVIALPEGFTELLPGMSPYYETMQAYVAPSNYRYLTLLRNEKANALLAGEHVDLLRYMTIDSEKNLSGMSVSSEMFDEIRSAVRTQIDDAFAEANERMPEILKQGTASINDQFSTEIDLAVGEIVPLPAHLDVSYAVANSMFMNMAASSGPDDTPQESIIAATMLILHVRDKVLFLYVYGEESDLEWTRKTATDWAKQIVSANPLSQADETTTAEPESSGIDWQKAAIGALIGALIGGAFGLARLLGRRRKKKAP